MLSKSPNPVQERLLASGFLSTGFNWLLHMPTGSGKTWLAEQAISVSLSGGRRAIYLTPLRALADELAERWSQVFGRSTIGVFHGGVQRHAPGTSASLAQARLMIMTPERLDACTRAWRAHWTWIPEVDLIVVDEVHLLGDARRGPRLEGALLRVRRLNPFVRLLALSATIGNAYVIADWLDALVFADRWRPIPLTWRIVRCRNARDKLEKLLAEIGHDARDGARTLVFVQSRRRAESIAQVLKDAGYRTEHHHGGLATSLRRQVEQRLRSGETTVLIATATLEAGLNLPLRRVILYDLQTFNGRNYDPLPVNSVWQRAGRAGRPGLGDQGEAVLFTPTWERATERYTQGDFEPILSALDRPWSLAEQILVEVATGLTRTRGELNRALSLSLAHRQGRLGKVHAAVDAMLDAGMLSEVPVDEGSGRLAQKLKPTPLGWVAVRQMLSPETVLALHRLATSPRAADLTFLDLLLGAVSAPDCEPILPVDFEQLGQLGLRLASEPSHLLANLELWREVVPGSEQQALPMLAKTALVARDWTRLGDADAVAERWHCYPFEVNRLIESLERILTTLAALSRATNEVSSETTPGSQPKAVACGTDWTPSLAERSEALSKMVTHGLDEEAVTLTFLPGVGGTLARRLKASGISDIEALALAETAEVAMVQGISQRRAATLISRAEGLVKTKSAFSLRDTGPTPLDRAHDWPPDVDPYRLGRAMELSVRSTGEATFVVTGGSEPRLVRASRAGGFTCNCPDFGNGNQCKHLLAVGIRSGDRKLTALKERLASNRDEQGHGALNLVALWVASREGRLTTRR